MSKYSVSDKDKKDFEKDELLDEVKKHIDKINVRKLDENNPHEQAIKFNEVKKNPPHPDFMKVKVYKEKDENGNDILVSESIQFDGKTKRLKHDPIFEFSPFVGFMANIAKCPMNVGDMLIDQAMNMVYEEKKAFKPEKRSSEFNYWWIAFIACIAIPAVFVIWSFL